MKYNVIETKKTWKIVDKRDDYKLISLKWIFIYKSDSNDFLFKYKARIVIRDDLQKVNNTQNVYAATFALKIEYEYVDTPWDTWAPPEDTQTPCSDTWLSK
jgi:hypothetical protein